MTCRGVTYQSVLPTGRIDHVEFTGVVSNNDIRLSEKL